MGNDFKFLKGNIETIILNALFNGDKYGYEIAKEIKEKTENKYEIKQPTLYGYLKRLEEQDLVEFYWGEESHGGRRKYFRLTAHGKTTCEQYLSEWNFHRNILDSLISDQSDDLPEYTPEDNVFLGSKGTRKRKSRKDFKDESENQQLLTELLKLSQSSNEEIANESENITTTETTDILDDNTATLTQEQFEEQVATFVDEQIFDDTSFVSQENIEETSVCTEEYYIDQTEEPIITTQPIIERKAGDVAETEISNSFSTPDTDFSSNFVDSPAETTFDTVNNEPVYDHYDNISTNTYIEQNVSSPSTQSTEENETEAQYKQILNNLLGEQIVNTDEKIAQIKHQQISYYQEEVAQKDISITEMADSLAKEGYRIRFYNTATSQYKAVPMLIKNKINCITAWSTLVAFYVLFGLSCLICGSGISFWGIFATAFAFLMIPLYFTYVYIKKPNIKIKSTHDFKQAIISKTIACLVISLLIIIFSLILFKTDFSNSNDVIFKLIMPELAALMIVVSEIIYNVFSKQKTFYN